MLVSRDTRKSTENRLLASRSAGTTAILGRIGSLEVRLAEGDAEIGAAQTLRYRVFHEELGACGEARFGLTTRDEDWIDAICDHLIVVDRTVDGRGEKVVGTYRLLLHHRAMAAGGFYSDGEFELSELVNRHPGKQFLELGRSCVLRQYRSRRVVELLWQGIWAYCRRHGVDVMAGCASFPGTIPASHALALAYLHHNCRASDDWQVEALPSRHVSMDMMPAEAIDARPAIAAMPPLVKGYLRLGGKVGDGCVIDKQFNTIDVLIVLSCEWISKRYLNHYGQEATRYAA